jgi:hypothetical protein
MQFFRKKTISTTRPKVVVIGCVLTVGIVLVGCGPGQADKEFLGKMERTKQQSKASEIKDIAIAFSLTHKPREVVSSQEVPKFISKLPMLSEATDDVDFNYLTEDISGTNAVMFYIGSGSGYSGIIVCPFDTDDCRKARGSLTGTVIPWDGGVYFWASWKVIGVSKGYWNK